MERKLDKSTKELAEELNRAMIEAFAKDLPEGTNLYSRDK